MGNLKQGKRNIRKLSKVGGGKSFAITLPIELVKKLGWKEKQKLVLAQKGRHLVVKDFRA